MVDLSGKLSILRRIGYELYLERSDTDFFAWHPWNENDLLIGMNVKKVHLFSFFFS